MRKLDEILEVATKEGWAVPHFNFATADQLRAIAEVCTNLKSPVIAGTSEGERNFIGPSQAVMLIESYRNEGLEIFLNADHTRSVSKAKEAIDMGYSSVHIDLSKEDFENNLTGTKEVVEYARASGNEISVEGEVGYLPTESSKVYKEEIKIEPDSFTKPDQAEKFVKETGVNRFAPAVGNLHGIAANEPRVNFDLVGTIRDRLPENVSIVLHGGSGIPSGDMKKVIKYGVANIHVSTEIRKSWKEGLFESIKNSPDEYAPYRILRPAYESVLKTVEEKIEIFGSKNKSKSN